MTPEQLRDALRGHRLVAIVRGRAPDAALRTVVTLVECGVRLVEVSLSTPDAVAVIARARGEVGTACVLGAGTVLEPGDVRPVADAGGAYVVTPAHTGAEAVAHELGLPVLAGAFTPSEILAAHESGAAAVKLFPASLHGPAYLRALRDPLPHVPLVPVGGVDADAAHAYLEAGAVAVGVGSPLVGDAASGGSLDDLRKRAAVFLAATERR
ncbi:MAG: bifunctional 4-hydroxy-2-oxoglutarate aldolase/2-dehydro-3-deoxy-phosphogluconate aldolase [Acidothermales bacterium]|nr:bifunctional 4-hydroxy-2-oxoglutarate aldolase/2-dehydro-3-deoxy-phosphogluconate aldolase [Acidothermales bacterium]